MGDLTDSKLLDRALDTIVELVKSDPSDFCEVVNTNEEGWCENNCENFGRICLLKYLKYRKPGELDRRVSI